MAATDGNRRETAWLQEMVAAVGDAADAATDPDDFTGALASALAAVEPNRFVWLGSPDPESDRIRVHATSDGGNADLSISLGGSQQPGPTARARSEGAVVRFPDVTANPEYGPLGVQFDVPATDASLSVPVAVGAPGLDTCVLHLYTTADVSGPAVREAGNVLGEVVADSYRALAGASAVERERRRLEELRRTLSHDFGNPLNLASGRLELAAEEHESPHLDHARGALDRIETLASECVSFVEAGQPVTDTAQRSVATLAEQCWEALSTGDCTLDTAGTAVECEPERLGLLLTELLDNAVDHTDGPVTVSVGPLGTGRGFYVQDTGEGIPADERAYVFDRGYTTDPDRPGQGLALAREVAAAHGWQLRLADGDGGARFEILTDRWTNS